MNVAAQIALVVLLFVLLAGNIACWLEKEDYKNELRRNKLSRQSGSAMEKMRGKR